MKRVKTICAALSVAGGVLLAVSLVFFLLRWSSLPEEAGVHFDPYGAFDVYASRFYGFYPHIVGAIGIAVLGVASILSCSGGSDLTQRTVAQTNDPGSIEYAPTKLATNNSRLCRPSSRGSYPPVGLAMSEKGDILFRTVLSLSFACGALLWGTLFAYWSYCVSVQQPLSVGFRALAVTVFLALAAVSVAAEIVIYLIFRDKSAPKKLLSPEMEHRLSHVIPIITTCFQWICTFFIWDRLPGDPALRYNPEYTDKMLFAMTGEYVGKGILFILPVAASLTVIVTELASRKAMKSGKKTLTVLSDDIRMTVSTIALLWDILLLSEMPFGIVSTGCFALMCITTVIRFIRNRKSEQ